MAKTLAIVFGVALLIAVGFIIYTQVKKPKATKTTTGVTNTGSLGTSGEVKTAVAAANAVNQTNTAARLKQFSN